MTTKSFTAAGTVTAAAPGAMPPSGAVARLARATAASVRVFLRDLGNGLLEVGHNGLAMLGLALAAIGIFTALNGAWRAQAEAMALDWLQSRHEARAEPAVPAAVDTLAVELSEPDAIARATATDPRELSRQQAAVANWLSSRYRVAPEPISRLVQEAWSVGRLASLDPTLILAIMAIESSFNPFAQSKVGAQGLMQVMTKLHDDKYQAFGGSLAAFDPVTNLRVGVQVLKECIARAGGLEPGLRFYVGAANLPDDGGYANKVLGEQKALQMVASGKLLAPQTRIVVAKSPAAAASTPIAATARQAQVPAPVAAAEPEPAPRVVEPAPASPVAAPPSDQLAMLR